MGKSHLAVSPTSNTSFTTTVLRKESKDTSTAQPVTERQAIIELNPHTTRDAWHGEVVVYLPMAVPAREPDQTFSRLIGKAQQLN